MSIITDAELADLRATALQFLDAEAVIFARETGVDDYGHVNETFVESETVACRLDLEGVKPTQAEQVEGEAGVPQEVFHLSLPVGTLVNEGDRVVINEATYAIVSALDTRSHSAVLRMLVKRVGSLPMGAAETSIFPEGFDEFDD